MLALRFTGRRQYSSTVKPSIKLVGELRKLTDVSISKARDALVATNNDVQAAAKWLEKDMMGSGAKKLEKLEGRSTNEGVIALSVLRSTTGTSKIEGQPMGGCTRAAMIELNCETDFVGRNQLLRKLASDIAHTMAFLAEPTTNAEAIFHNLPVDPLNDAPFLPAGLSQSDRIYETIGTHIRNTVVKLGEKITLRRAITHCREAVNQANGRGDYRVTSYIHGSVGDDSNVGRVGALVALALDPPEEYMEVGEPGFSKELVVIERAIARQIVGLNAIRTRGEGKTWLGQTPNEESDVLYEQPFLMHPAMSSSSVGSALEAWKTQRGLQHFQVHDFVKWRVGGADL